MRLPNEFVARMRTLLGAEADLFFQSYDQKHTYGLRINPLKYNINSAQNDLPFTLTSVKWASEGFYAMAEEHPGRHPLHEGGAYYIQEPSAMSVTSLLDPKPDDKVCDLCAAPGGKSTHIAGRLCGKGLLVSNEISPSRAKILSQNIERLGIGNCIVCNEPPDKIAGHFPLFFDKIVVDTPCSGEGMFRKDENAISEWSAEHIDLCKERQKMILNCADQMLSPGGIMVYSTCTFAPEEDEQMIAWFLQTHPDYTVEDWREILPENCNLDSGNPEFLGKTGSIDTSITALIPNTLRIWPHKVQGEGHFAARLRKKGNKNMDKDILKLSSQQSTPTGKKQPKRVQGKKADLSEYAIFSEQFLRIRPKKQQDTYSITNRLANSNSYQYFGDELYLIPSQINSLDGLKVIRAGLHLGTRKKNRFEPAHALAMALHPEDTVQSLECTTDEAIQYLKGDVINCNTKLKSWVLVCYQGISLGWGKANNGILKNHYPKGLRIRG